MKILQIMPVFSSYFGGPVTSVRNISKQLAKKHQLVVYTTTALDSKHDFDSHEEFIDDYKVIYFNRTPKVLSHIGFFGQLNLSYGMLRAVRQNLQKFDVVHVTSWREFPDILAHYYAKKYSVPYVLHPRGALPRIMTKQQMKWLYDQIFGYNILNCAAKVIALNSVEKMQCLGMGVSEEKIEVIPNGVDLSEYSDLPPKGAFRKKFSLNEKEKIVLYVGRIHKIKGIDILVKAFANIIKKLNNIKLVIVGPDDGYLVEITNLIAELGLSKYVLLTGPLFGRSKLEAFIDADFSVVPSRYEIFGNVVLESYACSTPVIASRVGGLQEIVSHGETGFLVGLGNVDELSSALHILLNNDDLRNRMSINAKKFVESKFSIEKIVDKLEKTYVEILRR